MDDKLSLITYARNKSHYIFFLRLLSNDEKHQNFFAVRKGLKEVEDLGNDTHSALIQPETDITLFT